MTTCMRMFLRFLIADGEGAGQQLQPQGAALIMVSLAYWPRRKARPGFSVTRGCTTAADGCDDKCVPFCMLDMRATTFCWLEKLRHTVVHAVIHKPRAAYHSLILSKMPAAIRARGSAWSRPTNRICPGSQNGVLGMWRRFSAFWTIRRGIWGWL